MRKMIQVQKDIAEEVVGMYPNMSWTERLKILLPDTPTGTPTEEIAPEGFIKCTKCKTIKPYESFHRNNKIKSTGRASMCKICFKKYWQGTKDGLYYVYLLPEENYVGITSHVKRRMTAHKDVHKRNIKGMRVLYSTTNRQEGFELESFLHTLGYKGGLHT